MGGDEVHKKKRANRCGIKTPADRSQLLSFSKEGKGRGYGQEQGQNKEPGTLYPLS
jgi:hypothetical protein